VEIGGHNIHEGSGGYVTTVVGADRWDLAGRTGAFFVTAFDRTPGGAQIGPRSNTVTVGGNDTGGDSGGDTGGDSGGDTGGNPGGGPALPDGFRCGNWPPLPSSTGEGQNATDDAIAAASTQCGEDYDDQDGDKCVWMSDPAGWQCRISGESGNPGGDLEPPDPTIGGPSGDGPLVPSDVRAVEVSGDTQAVNPNGIRVSWIPGGGPESIGFNIHRAENGGEREFLLSLVGRSPVDGRVSFVDCNVTAGTSYQYTVSAWAEGSKQSFTTLPVEGSTTTTPSTCRPLTPPGPSGDNEPSTHPLFDVPRTYTAKPATPENVRIVGSGASARLQWEMPRSARMVFQVTRNALREAESDDLWGQIQITPGHQDMTFADRGDGGVRMSFPVGNFSPGDNFAIQATHPWSISKDEIASTHRFSKQSRFATITRAGNGNTQPNFFDSLDTSAEPAGSWIGSKSDWNPTPQFRDDFDGAGELASSANVRYDATNGEPTEANRWYFARNDAPTDITAAPDRNQNQTDDRAILRDGKLEMSARVSDGSYSYIGTANDQGDGYLIDPTNGVFVEASVRLDRMTPADNAWWAFWLMAPGASPCQTNGAPLPGGTNAYDGHTQTGVELDLFEFVPDLNNGYNQALFRYAPGKGKHCQDPGQRKVAPEGKGFTYEGFDPPFGVDLPKYMDGNYHRLGLYYAQDCYAVYIDDTLLWQVTEEANPGWITTRAKESIRLTWEIQDYWTNDQGRAIEPVWTDRPGAFANTALDSDPTVYIDYVNVWEKKETANGLCSGGPDPVPEPEPQPDPELTAPVNVTIDTDNGTTLRWEAGEGLAPDGYDIRRGLTETLDPEVDAYWSLDGPEPSFPDPGAEVGTTYFYQIVPWAGPADARKYGPASEVVSVTVTSEPSGPENPNAPAAPINPVADLSNGTKITWQPGEGLEPDGYDIQRKAEGETEFAGHWSITGTEFTDPLAEVGTTYSYRIVAWIGIDVASRQYGPASEVVTVTAETESPENPNPGTGVPNPNAPGVPVNFGATATTDALMLNWEVGDGLEPDGFDITRDDSGYWSIESNVTTFADPGVQLNQSYKYSVTAWLDDAEGVRQYSNRSTTTSR